MKVTFLSTLLLAVPALASDHVFQSTDVFELEVAADPRISPDGRRIAYVRRSMDIMNDSTLSSIWIIDADGSDHRPLLSGESSHSSPRWSPSGDRLAYVTRIGDRGGQIHMLWMDTRQTGVLTNVRESPSSITWSPDGRWLAFSMFVPDEPGSLAKPLSKPEGAEWADPVTVIETLPYRADGRGYLETGYSHLFVLPAEGGTPRQLTEGDYNHGGDLAWSPEGDRILFAANRQDDWQHDPVESELWSVDVASGELTRLTDRDGPDFAPTISPDGRTVAYLGFDDRKMGYHTTDVYLMSYQGGQARVLTSGLDRSIQDVQWAGSSDELMIQYEDHGRRHLAALSPDGTIEVLTDDVGGVTLGRPYNSGGFSVSNAGSSAYTASRMLVTIDSGAPEALANSVW